AGDALEGVLQLGEVAHLDHQMEVAQAGRGETELAAGEPPTLDQPLVFQVAHVGGDLLGEFQVADAGLEVAPGVVDVHRGPPLVVEYLPLRRTSVIASAAKQSSAGRRLLRCARNDRASSHAGTSPATVLPSAV